MVTTPYKCEEGKGLRKGYQEYLQKAVWDDQYYTLIVHSSFQMILKYPKMHTHVCTQNNEMEVTLDEC